MGEVFFLLFSYIFWMFWGFKPFCRRWFYRIFSQYHVFFFFFNFVMYFIISMAFNLHDIPFVPFCFSGLLSIGDPCYTNILKIFRFFICKLFYFYIYLLNPFFSNEFLCIAQLSLTLYVYNQVFNPVCLQDLSYS